MATKRGTPEMTCSEELQWRGFIQQTTLDDLTVLDKNKLTFYHGFDASADSQTVGNLAAMMLDKLLMRHGHNAIILAGGSTSLIGDPGGKDKERPLQNEATIAHNVNCAEKQLKKIFSEHNFKLVNNIDWTRSLSVLTFLRDIGKHFSISELVSRDYIANRLGEGGAGISYTEFSYTLLQGMDYLHLFDTYGVTLQIGGSDQWGNCLSGVELIRKTRGKSVNVITLPLIINKATGKKFGKSEGGAIWLDETKTSVYKFYQFWLNSDDEGVEDYLKVFTELSKPEIDNAIAEFKSNTSSRSAQRLLAYNVTKLVHGEAKANLAVTISNVVFGGKPFKECTPKDVAALAQELPVVQFKNDNPISSYLQETGLATSSTEARRFIADGAITISGNMLRPEHKTIVDDWFVHDYALIKRGKNKLALLKK